MPKFLQFQGRVAVLIQDAAGKLKPEDRDALIAQAIQQRYSKDRPLEIVSDAPGSNPASNDVALPIAPGQNPAGVWEDGFSFIRSIEFPIGNNPPVLLLGDRWTMYRSPAGLKVRLLDFALQPADSVRMTWTARHAGDGSTIYPADFEAICDFAASLCCETLAAIYTQTGDATMQADVVNYRTKNQEYLSLARALRKRYFNHVGVEEDATGKGETAGPVIATGEMHQTLAAGVDRITHARGSR